MINLMHGDCLELMKQIPDNSIDCVLTDPPYGTTACKWDTVIDFELMREQLKRITKDNGAICLFGIEPFSSTLRMSNIKMFKYDWLWEKNRCTNFMQAKFAPMSNIEIIKVFSRGGAGNGCKVPMIYYPQGVVEINKTIKSRRSGGKQGIAKRTPNYKGNMYTQKLTNFPKKTLKFNMPEGASHPTQKPVALLEYLIKTYTLENETVLDFTMGSGSTGVACRNLNRKFIGIEMDDKYFEVARERIGV